MSTSIIIADDHPLILKGLNDFLLEKKYNVIASAKNGKEAITLIKAHQPDIAILDIQMPMLSGLQVAEQCKEAQLGTKIIIITFEKSEEIYRKAKTLGIYGYILKEFAIAELETCIANVLNERQYFSPELMQYLEIKETPEELKELTATEMKILKRIANNETGVMMAEAMHVSVRTVEKHKSNIIKKLNLNQKQNSLVIWVKENEDYII
ncbi:MAG: response regulator transcription factor [Psychroserpens sp.]|uniref:response regulator n=1 Tax=Psychroserpens sp. TaxID=2020870 RepID=UPI003C7713F8